MPDTTRNKENISLGVQGEVSQMNTVLGTRKRTNDEGSEIFGLGPKKRPTRTDPLVHHGHHFGRTIRAFCRVQALIKEGLSIDIQLELGDMTLDELPEELEERICTGSEQEVFHVADMITRGSNNARSDDTRALKSAVIDWITPTDGVLRPPLQRNVKTDRGFHHSRTGELLCPANLDWKSQRVQDSLRTGRLIPSGDQWPMFLYRDHIYDSEDPWNGLLRGELLVNGFKHVFTSPSSVDKAANRATRSSNAGIHGMQSVTFASLAYIATQASIRFALCSSPIFSRSDMATDSEKFYNSIMVLLEDPEECDEVKKLMAWWDRQIFPVVKRALPHSDTRDSVYQRIKEKRRERNARALEDEVPTDESITPASDGPSQPSTAV